jgi:hypothetical protein
MIVRKCSASEPSSCARSMESDEETTKRDAQSRWPLRDALRTAHAVLDGKMGVIEGCIALASYAHDVVPDWRVDADLVIFGAIASDTDHLPFGEVRSPWGQAALARADEEIEAICKTRNERVRERLSAGS